MSNIFTLRSGQVWIAGRHFRVYLIGLFSLWSTSSAIAQPSAFVANQIEVGIDCNWPFNAITTNPVEGRMYARWRKGANENLTYKRIRWDGSSWAMVSTFTTATGTSSSFKVPDLRSRVHT